MYCVVRSAVRQTFAPRPGTARHGPAPRRARRAIALADRRRCAAPPVRRGRPGARRSRPRGGIAVRGGPLGGRRPLCPAGPRPPLRLLTLFASDERALAQVRRRRAAIERRLTHVAGRAEWGVQARLDMESGPRPARPDRDAAADGGTQPGHPVPPAPPPRARSGARARRRRAERGGEAVPRVARHADDARQRPPVSVEGRPALLLDAAFLVPETGAALFRRPSAPRQRRRPSTDSASD